MPTVVWEYVWKVVVVLMHSPVEPNGLAALTAGSPVAAVTVEVVTVEVVTVAGEQSLAPVSHNCVVGDAASVVMGNEVLIIAFCADTAR